MTEYPINIPEIESRLAEGRLGEVLDSLQNIASGLAPLASWRPRLTALRQQYGYMADYALRGLPDPGLEENHANLTAEIRMTADSMLRALMTADAPSLYYSILRTSAVSPRRPLADTIAECGRIAQKLALAALTENPGEATAELTRRSEALESELFTTVWTTHPLSTADTEALTALMADRALPESLKQLVVSALTLGIMEWLDPRKAMLLMDTYASAERPETALRALCGILLWLWFHRSRPMDRNLRLRLESLRELPGWEADVRTATMEFLRARDTERLTRKFTDEVLPEMMKLRPEIEKLSRTTSDPEAITASIEENPEWADMLEKSGLADRLREMQEMQEDGDDVMMATFSMLKTFPFFHDVAAWFLPFSPGRSVFRTPGMDEFAPLLDMLAGASTLCDSDRYSVALSLDRIPAAQRNLMAEQFRLHAGQMDAIRASSLDTPASGRREIVANYVRNLYRFFKLFRRKGEFKDPFALGLNLPALKELADVFDNPDTLSLIGEFYFKRHYFEDAFEIFERLDMAVTPSASLYQKMGYCRHALGDIPEALRYYEQSEMLDSANRWTRRRLAACHKALGNWESTLRYYKSLAEDRPDDVSLCLNTGLCLMKLKRFDEAMATLFKAEYLGAESPKALRAIVWCTLLSGDIQRARTYSDRVLGREEPTPTDLLNAGHIELIDGHPDRAASFYARSLALRDFDVQGLLSDLGADAVSISGLAAVSPLLRAIVADRAVSLAADFGSKI